MKPERSFNSSDFPQGKNSAHFSVPTLGTEIKFNVFLYGKHEHLVFTDIDGTITKGDVTGFVGGTLGLEVHHEGVVRGEAHLYDVRKI